MPNPLETYRRAQRELRREFDAFTRVHCPTCPTPCCRRPARIMPTDLALARSVGWKSPVIPLEPVQIEEVEGAPCEYLGEKGCAFPNDLRPFGCTTFICRIMYQELDAATLRRIKRLVRALEQAHTDVLRSQRAVEWDDELP